MKIFTFLFFNLAQAANEGLVPCSGLDCDFCDLFKLGENVFTFAIFNVALPIAVIFVIYGGFKIMTAGSSPEKVSEGRKIIQAAAIGILIQRGIFILLYYCIFVQLTKKCLYYSIYAESQ